MRHVVGVGPLTGAALHQQTEVFWRVVRGYQLLEPVPGKFRFFPVLPSGVRQIYERGCTGSCMIVFLSFVRKRGLRDLKLRPMSQSMLGGPS